MPLSPEDKGPFDLGGNPSNIPNNNTSGAYAPPRYGFEDANEAYNTDSTGRDNISNARTWDSLNAVPIVGNFTEAADLRSRNPFVYMDENGNKGRFQLADTDPARKMWEEELKRGALSENRASPYQRSTADQGRDTQMALLNQMRGTADGPSLAAMQATKAMGANMQRGAMAAALGNRRAALMGTQMGSQGLASDAGSAALNEQMRLRAGLGGFMGDVRGQDQAVSRDEVNAALAQRRADEARRLGFAKIGTEFDSGLTQAENEGLKTYAALRDQLQDNKTRAAQLEAQGVKETATTIMDIIKMMG